MKTLSLNELKLRVIYLESDPIVRTKFINAFSQQVFISSFKNTNGVIDWLLAGNEIDLIIINEQLGWLSFLENLRVRVPQTSVQFILISPVITYELCQQAVQAGIVDIFPSDFIEEDIRGRFEYLVLKKEYFNSPPVTSEMPQLSQIPIWKRAIDLVASIYLPSRPFRQ